MSIGRRAGQAGGGHVPGITNTAAKVCIMPDSPVINDSDDFVPMPTPDQVVAGAQANRLDPIPFEFSDIRALAQRILKRAQEQAQQKLDAARKQVAAMEKQAHDKAYQEAFPKGQEEGFAKGQQEGMAAAEEKIAAAVEGEKESLRQNSQPVVGVLEQLASIMNDNRQQLMAQAEGDLLLLALDIAKRLVGHELSVDPEAIRPLAVECIGLVTDRSAITARVNPEDKRVMEDILPQLKTIFPDLGPVQIEADPAIERGGIMASTREAEVDMRLATRFAAFEEAILGYSGENAVAPWSAIPADAIAAAKQTESPYSLPPPEDETTSAEESPAAPKTDEAAEPEANNGDETEPQLPVAADPVQDEAEEAEQTSAQEEPPAQQ